MLIDEELTVCVQKSTLKYFKIFQVRNALAEPAKKDGIDDTPTNMFNYLIDRVRGNLHVVLCMSPVGEPFRYCEPFN